MSSETEKERGETSELVDLLTSSGKHALDPEPLKKLKKLCRTSDDLLRYCHYLLMLRLQQDDSNVRYSALLVVDELFRRSHLFRTLLLDDLQGFLELVLETNADLPLPAPVAAAKELKAKAAQVVGSWQDQFGASYRVLELAANFLKRCKQIPLGSDTAAAESQARRSSAERLLKDITERVPEAEALLTQLENCLRLIIPPVDEDDGCEVQDGPGPSTEATQSSDLTAHGMGPTFTLQVTLEPRVVASGDNAVLLQTLADQRRELTTVFLPRVKRWLKSLAKVTHPRAAEVLRRTVDLKRRLEAARDKCNELHVQQAASSDDDDLEEVPEKEGFEPVIPAHRRAEYGLEPVAPAPTVARRTAKQWSLCDPEEEPSDPTSREAQLHRLAQKLATSSASQQPSTTEGCGSKEAAATAGPSTAAPFEADGSKKAAAPRRHYDVDLYHWEDEKLEPPTLGRTDDLHHVWVGSSQRDASEATVPEDWCAALRERRIDFSGEFVPIKWTCRAPLPSGKLCPRQDRYKCPFHGPIVPRDSMGQPEGGDTSGLQGGQKGRRPDWQDPALLRDIEAATGVNLEVGRRKKRKEKKPAVPDNPRKRLEKKVFNKRSVRRVASTMDAIDSRKFDDKFGNQWNYAFNA